MADESRPRCDLTTDIYVVYIRSNLPIEICGPDLVKMKSFPSGFVWLKIWELQWQIQRPKIEMKLQKDIIFFRLNFYI